MWPGISHKKLFHLKSIRVSFDTQTDVHANPKIQAKQAPYDLALQLSKQGLLILITVIAHQH